MSSVLRLLCLQAITLGLGYSYQMDTQKRKTFTCEICNRSNIIDIKKEFVNGHLTALTDCYFCKRRYEVYGNEIQILPEKIFTTEKVEIKKKQSSFLENVFPLIMAGLFLIGVVCFVIDYFSKSDDSNQISSNINQETFNSNSYNDKSESNLSESITTKLISPVEERVYEGKFTLDENENYIPDNFSIQFKENQISYNKNGNMKYFDVVYEGIYTHEEQPNIKFDYYQYHLKNKNTYLLVSVNKEINYQGTFYYRLIIDGQTQLAL